MDRRNNQRPPNAVAGETPGTARETSRPPLVVIAGPTAVGKTALGIELASRFGGEIVSADSRYLYRGLNIGVAKPDLAERRNIPHHLIDIIPPDGEMSLATFQDRALRAIASINARGRQPFLVGGTPLYVNAVVEGWRIPSVPPNPSVRAALEAEAAEHGVAALTARLRAVDPIAAERCGTNLRRVVRALEIYEATGVPMSAQEGKGPPPFATLELGLTMPRADLFAAIDRRVDDQIVRGLVDEVRALLDGGLAPHAPSMSSIGYRQLLPYLAGELTLAEAITRIKSDSHRYVRHQETWLRRNPRLVRLDVSEPGLVTQASDLVERFLAGPTSR